MVSSRSASNSSRILGGCDTGQDAIRAGDRQADAHHHAKPAREPKGGSKDPDFVVSPRPLLPNG
jgi:hypothetical protein